jgi:hypothetical protein
VLFEDRRCSLQRQGTLHLGVKTVIVVGGDSTPCMFGLGKNNANSADRAGSVWIVGQPEAIQKRASGRSM